VLVITRTVCFSGQAKVSAFAWPRPGLWSSKTDSVGRLPIEQPADDVADAYKEATFDG